MGDQERDDAHYYQWQNAVLECLELFKRSLDQSISANSSLKLLFCCLAYLKVFQWVVDPEDGNDQCDRRHNQLGQKEHEIAH